MKTMAEPLTDEEFALIFKQPNVSVVPSPRPQRRYGAKLQDDPAVADAVRDASIASPKRVGPVSEASKSEIPYTSATDRLEQQTGAKIHTLMPTAAEGVQANAVAGVLALPASVPAIVDLVRFGIPAVVSGAVDPEEGEGILNTIADNFSKSVITPENEKQLQAVLGAHVQQYINQNPMASKDEVDAVQEQFLQSDVFYNEVQKRLPLGFGTANVIQDAANSLAGVGKRSDQMTAGDDLTQIIASSFIGLPAASLAKVSGAITRKVGERVANNMAVRIGARTLEAVTPLTLPLTKSNIAINAGVGAAMSEGIRSVQDADTFIDYDSVFDQLEKAPAIGVGAGAAAAMFSPGAMMRGIRKQAGQNAQDALSKLREKEGLGVPLDEQDPNKLVPQTNSLSGSVDDISQLKSAGKKFGADDEDLYDLEIAAVSGTFHARKEVENRIHQYGELDLSHKTVPLRHIEAAMDSFTRDERINLENYLYAIGREQDTKIQMMRQADMVSKKLGEVAMHNLRGDQRALARAQAELAELRQAYTDMATDTFDSRPSFPQWSQSVVHKAIQLGNQNPKFTRVRDMITKYGNDMLDYARRHGEISDEDFIEFRKSRPLHIKVQERSVPHANGLKRRALLFGKRLKRDFQGSEGRSPDSSMPRAARDLDVRETGKVHVGQQRDVMSSLRDMTTDVVYRVQTNEARRNIVNKLRQLPNAEGRLMRAHVFDSRTGATSVTRPQFDMLVSQNKIKNLDKYVRVNDGNRVQLWEFGDPGLKAMLEFNPNVALPILNATRKIYQHGMTGLLRPAFSVTQAYREPWLAAATKPEGRSLGVLNTFLYRALEGTSLQKMTNKVNIPFDAHAAAVPQIPIQLWERSVKALSNKILMDFANDSGVMSKIIQMTGGRAYVENIAQRAALAMEHTSYGIMTNRMSASFGHLNDISDVFDDYARGAKSKVPFVGPALNAFKALLESFQMSTRLAFFSENLGNLSRRYGGIDKIPQREMAKLELDTRNLTGDMSRRSKSRGVQYGMSATPYGNTIMQGTRHFLAAMGETKNSRTKSFWPAFVTGVAIPKLLTMAAITEMEGGEDWWYNKTPAWQRMVVMPVPTVEAITARITTGEWPKGDPAKNFYKIPLPPEFAIIMTPFEAMVQAAGFFGKSDVPKPPVLESIQQSFMNIIDIPTHPLIGAVAAWTGVRGDIGDIAVGNTPQEFRDTPSGGINADKVSPNNTMSKWFYEMIGSFLGTGGKNAADGLNVAELSLKDGDTIIESAQKAVRTWADQERQGLPEVGIPLLYDVASRNYAFTPQAEYVTTTMRGLEGVFKQLSRERDTSGRAGLAEEAGGQVANKIKDPRLLNLAQIVYDETQKKGEFKQATEDYTTYRTLLHSLPRQRMTTTEYQRQRNAIIKKQQSVYDIQAGILRDMEEEIREATGEGFEQAFGEPFSYKALAKLIERDVSR